MTKPRRFLILPLLALPSLFGCGGSGSNGPPAVTQEALSVVAKDPGVEPKSLARAVDALFQDEDAGDTRALLVLYRGRIVAERYGQGYDRKMPLIGWSMTKTVTGVMIGMLVADGRLRLDEGVPVPNWRRPGDPRGEITLRQLLQMRSGLRHTETEGPLYKTDMVRMLFTDGRDNMAAYAEAQPLEAEPGRKFEYSTPTSVILSDIAANVLTESADPAVRKQVVGDYLRTRLFDPLGMHSMVPEYDAAGTLIGSSYLHGTARDRGKFGEFLRHGGSINGAQLIPRAWIDFMTSSSPRNPGYGAHLWLNRPQADGSNPLFVGKAPADMFACIGHLGQYVIVSPRQKLTIVRLGKSSSAERGLLRERLAAIIALFPSEQADLPAAKEHS